MKHKLAKLTLALASALFVSQAWPVTSQAQTSDQVRGVVENKGAVSIDWSEGLIRVTGVGAPPDRGSSSQRRLLAERNAMDDAYQQLREAIETIRVNAETIVRDHMDESDMVKTKVQSLVRSAQKVDRRYLSDGSIEVDVVLKLYSQSGLSGILQPQKSAAPAPPVDLKPEPFPGDYTGVIVDCRGLGVKPAMGPAILSQDGGEVFLGNFPIEPDYVINHGVVGYAHSLMEARQHQRMGNNPLIVKGLNPSGTFSTDVVISAEDAAQILGLQEKHRILEQAKVMLVM